MYGLVLLETQELGALVNAPEARWQLADNVLLLGSPALHGGTWVRSCSVAWEPKASWSATRLRRLRCGGAPKSEGWTYGEYKDESIEEALLSFADFPSWFNFMLYPVSKLALGYRWPLLGQHSQCCHEVLAAPIRCEELKLPRLEKIDKPKGALVQHSAQNEKGTWAHRSRVLRGRARHFDFYDNGTAGNGQQRTGNLGDLLHAVADGRRPFNLVCGLEAKTGHSFARELRHTFGGNVRCSALEAVRYLKPKTQRYFYTETFGNLWKPLEAYFLQRYFLSGHCSTKKESFLLHSVHSQALEEVLKMAPKLDAKGFAAVLAACQRLDIVEGLDFLKTALDEQIPLTEASYVHGINLCVAYGKWELSLEVLNQVVQLGISRELDWKMLGAARRTCLEAGQWQKVLELSEKSSEHSEQDAYGYAAQMIALERLGQLQEAYHLFKEMVENSVTPNQHVYAALIGDGSDENAWQRALHLLEDSRLRSVTANQMMFGKAINCCVPAAQWEAALCLLRDMDRACCVSCVALSSALRACGEGLQWQRALGLLHAAPKLSVEQDADLWNFAICACSLAGKGRMAEQLLRSMKAKKVMPSLECYHSTLNAMGCDAEDTFNEDAVARLLSVMQKEGLEPTTVTLNSALGVSVQKGRWQEALAFGQRLRKQSIAPSEVTYGELISACKESRKWQVALSLLEASLAEDSTTSVTTFNIAISVCESSGKLELAIRLLRRMQELGLKPDVYSYNAVLAACQDAGDWQMGLAIFEEMKKQSIMPDIYSYGAVILSCSMAMQWEWAVNLWHQMESQGLAANGVILSSVAGVCSRCGQQAWVDYLLAEMRRRGASLDNNAFSVSVDLDTDAGAVAAEEEESHSSAAAPVAEEESEQLEQQKLSGASLKVFMEKVEGASKLYMEALKDGAFTPWVRPGRLLDLHGMSTEVAKVAVYVALSGVPDLEEDDLAFLWGLKIIVGKGIHSKDNQVVLEPVVRELLEDVFQLQVSETSEGAFRVYRQDIWAIKCEGVWPPKWLKEGKKPPKAWLQRRRWLPELPQSLRERSRRISKRLSRISTRDRALTAEKSLPKDILMNFCPCSRVGFKHLMQIHSQDITRH
ncbi:unnamed protein product [Cladocopium goreaui]|uniref:Pentatricopeptide repeat-containing protein At2g41720 (Protein EMBRYO DEFECTIVE 2654) n=1 Tax=Cladocopium goreaui TaxID=2562237 RepID=A0A9P1BZJ1_9DINO|nr:unnamed protein product [Cladocopium goreaui]